MNDVDTHQGLIVRWTICQCGSDAIRFALDPDEREMLAVEFWSTGHTPRRVLGWLGRMWSALWGKPIFSGCLIVDRADVRSMIGDLQAYLDEMDERA